MLTLLLLAATLTATTTSPELPPIVAPALDVSISIHPSSMDHYQLLKRKTPETYTCQALVSQAGTRVGLGTAELVVIPGTTEKTTRKLYDDYTMDFSVTLKSQHAEAVVTIKRGEQVIARQRSTVYISTTDVIVPVH